MNDPKTALERKAYHNLTHSDSIFNCIEEHHFFTKMKVLLFGFGILISTFCQARPWTDQSEDKIYHFENGNIMINGKLIFT